MKTKPLVSIITPMYNAEKFIDETINSVIAQTYTNWEMLIIDNCSTDSSREKVEKFNDDRIKLLELDYNSGGPARPRNIGLQNAKGEYIAFLDADDLWVDNKLEIQMNTLTNKLFDIVYSNASLIDDNSIEYLMHYHNKSLKYANKNLLFKNHIFTSSVVINKKKLSELIFNEDKDFVAIEDWILWLNLQRLGCKFYYDNKPLLKYRVLKNSTSNTQCVSSLTKRYNYLKSLFKKQKISIFEYYQFTTYRNFINGYKLFFK